MKAIKEKISKMPLALSGLALGVVGLTSAWSLITSNIQISYIGAAIASILVITVILKIFFDKAKFKNEVKNFVLGSMAPTIDMAIMVISASVVKFNYSLGKALWLFSIVVHFVLLAFFIYYRIKQRDIGKMLPSWFVPPIGIVVAAVTSSSMNMPFLAQGVFYFGFIFYIIMFPFVLYKILFVYNIEDEIAPAFAVMGAPPNLCLAGYLTAFETPNPVIIHLLLGIALFTTFMVYLSFFRVLKLKFSPIFAAYTFPLSIGATAIIRYYYYSMDKFNGVYNVWFYVAMFELLVATLVILIIFFNMMIFVYNNIIKNKVKN